MPFTSKAQMRFMYAKHPKIAKEMTKAQEKKSGKKSFKKLPEKKKMKDDFQLFGSMLETIDGDNNE